MERTGIVERVRGPHTWEEFLELEDDDRRELIDGEFAETDKLVESDVHARISHEYAVGALVTLLTNWAKQHGGGVVLPSSYKIRISDQRGVMPDVQFLTEDNPALRRENLDLGLGRPDLAVEVTSPSSRRYDRVTKLGYYASTGVPEYWIVDPEPRTLERFLLKGSHYLVANALADDAVFSPETFPDLEFSLSELWFRART